MGKIEMVAELKKMDFSFSSSTHKKICDNSVIFQPSNKIKKNTKLPHVVKKLRLTCWGKKYKLIISPAILDYSSCPEFYNGLRQAVNLLHAPHERKES